MSKFEALLENTLVRFQRSQFITGDLIKFKKNWQKNPWVQANIDYAQKIMQFIESGDNLRVSAVKASQSSVQGSYGTYENEQANLIDITQEFAPGLYRDFMTVPSNIIEVIDTGNNLAPLPASKKRKDSTQIKPSKIDKIQSDKDFSQGKQTKAGEGDRQLNNKNVKLPHGNKWNDKKPGAGNTKGLKKIKESFSLKKNDSDLIFEAYMNGDETKKPTDNQACPGCGCMPGDGITQDCNDPNGCGYNRNLEAQYNKMHPDHPNYADGTTVEPNQCYGCGKHQAPGEKWEKKLADLDPGNPENGPDPDICEVEYCPDCIKNNVTGPPNEEPSPRAKMEHSHRETQRKFDAKVQAGQIDHTGNDLK